jgi:hypothetical protein
MAVGVEDVVAVRSLETGLVPPVANFKEVDPELGTLNLSRARKHRARFSASPGRQAAATCARPIPADSRTWGSVPLP